MHVWRENYRTPGLRVMVQDDLREVLRIEAISFADPWSERDFVEHFENRDSVALVVEQRGLIMAYEVFRIRGPWIELHSCVVRPALRRRRLGSSMLAHVIRLSEMHEPSGVLVKVPERNVGTQLFFRHCGFRVARVLSAFLNDEQDVYVMKRAMPEAALPDFDMGTPEDELVPFWEVKHGCPLMGTRMDRTLSAGPAYRTRADVKR